MAALAPRTTSGPVRGLLEWVLRALPFAIPFTIAILLLVGVNGPDQDPTYYLRVAERVLGGQVPYRDFALEYPPLAVLPMLVPRLGSGAADVLLEQYQLALQVQNAVLCVVTGALVVFLAKRGWSARPARATALAYTAFAVAIAPMILWRYDAFPALLTALALAAMAMNRPGVAGVALGLGTVAKIYPALLLPIALGFYVVQRDARKAIVLLLTASLTTLAFLAPFLIVGGSGFWSFAEHQAERGLEIGSVLSGFVLLMHLLVGVPADTYFGFSSWQVASPLVGALAWPVRAFEAGLFTGFVAGTGLGFLWERKAAGGVHYRTLARYALAGLLLLVLTNKVLSPQYFVWLLPLAALMPRGQATALLLAAGLTTIIYPLHFRALIELDPTMIIVLNVRNLMLLIVFVWLVVPRHPRIQTIDTPVSGRQPSNALA